MESLTAKLNKLKDAYHEFLMGILDSIIRNRNDVKIFILGNAVERN